MPGLHLQFASAGSCFLADTYYHSHYKFKRQGKLIARGLVTKVYIPNGNANNSFMLSVTFTLKSGEPYIFQEAKGPKEKWYSGKPVLVEYRSRQEKTEIMQVLSFQQAYAKAFMLSLAGILFIVLGGSLL